MTPNTPATGGYLLDQTPLVRADPRAHTNYLDKPISPLHLDALNAIQATPWRINSFILDVASEIWTNGLGLAGIGQTVKQAVPARKGEAEWAGMSDKEKIAHRVLQGAAHSYNNTAEGKLSAFLETLTTATELRDQPSFYYPHSLDFRGRMYPVQSGGLSPQGNDLSKGLLMFSEGKPLGEDGEFWLRVRAANCAGFDKVSLLSRNEWVDRHKEDIIRSASDPLGHTWWSTQPEPWCLLATCLELSAAWGLHQSSEFISHLSIPLDGSCSGIQHLSAMGLDPVGAQATNLCGGARQDIYQDVAALVIAAVEEDALDGLVEALYWQTRVTRATVKRAVMTTPYGVSSRGIQQQLVLDGFCADAPPGDRMALSGYLRDKLTDALAATVVGARTIMGWLQEVAANLADAEVAFQWTTPVGTRIRQAYYADEITRVETLAGRFVLASSSTEGSLLKTKAASASAPNVVHSFDAAHMVLTVNAGNAIGISAWSMIHDSFGAHACSTTRLAAILREEFVQMYQTDWLGEIAKEVQSYAPHVKIPPNPDRGSFDLNRVRDSEFFFA